MPALLPVKGELVSKLDSKTAKAGDNVTFETKDSVKTASIDRIIGGEVAPDVPEIVMVRKPPRPGDTHASEAKPAAGGAR